MDVEYCVVIASDFGSIPPACFDSFHVTKESQGAATARHAFYLFQLLWSWEEPQGPAKRAPRNTGACANGLWFACGPCAFWAVALQYLESIDRFVPEPGAEAFD